jgi:hypothetical protein
LLSEKTKKCCLKFAKVGNLNTIFNKFWLLGKYADLKML